MGRGDQGDITAGKGMKRRGSTGGAPSKHAQDIADFFTQSLQKNDAAPARLRRKFSAEEMQPFVEIFTRLQREHEQNPTTFPFVPNLKHMMYMAVETVSAEKARPADLLASELAPFLSDSEDSRLAAFRKGSEATGEEKREFIKSQLLSPYLDQLNAFAEDKMPAYSGNVYDNQDLPRAPKRDIPGPRWDTSVLEKVNSGDVRAKIENIRSSGIARQGSALEDLSPAIKERLKARGQLFNDSPEWEDSLYPESVPNWDDVSLPDDLAEQIAAYADDDFSVGAIVSSGPRPFIQEDREDDLR